MMTMQHTCRGPTVRSKVTTLQPHTKGRCGGRNPKGSASYLAEAKERSRRSVGMRSSWTVRHRTLRSIRA